MLSNEIIRLLLKLPFKDFFDGIFARDNVPKQLKDRHFIILNTDIQSGPGKHWYTVLKINGVVECFDSLGIDDEKKKFLVENFNFRGAKYLDINRTQVQPSSSILCGEYVLYFLFERYTNLDMTFDDLLNEIFSNNLRENDVYVNNFISSFNHGSQN